MDCTLNENPWKDLEEKVRREKPDVIGISVICTAFIYDGMNAASLIKAVSPQSIIIMGGEHPSFMAEETLRDCPAIDYICVGEGEVTLTEFLRAVEKKGQDLLQDLGPRLSQRKGRIRLYGRSALHRGPRYPSHACLSSCQDGSPLCGPPLRGSPRTGRQFLKRMHLGLHLLL